MRDDGDLPSEAESQGVANLHQLWVGATAWTNGFSEWIGHRGVFARDAIACGGSVARSRYRNPDHSHEAEELYLLLAVTPLGVRRSPAKP